MVSILTGPEGPVLPEILPGGERRVHVSILTGPEGPVLPQEPFPSNRLHGRFNPHRPRRAGATQSIA